jgi:hypothetical protein
VDSTYFWNVIIIVRGQEITDTSVRIYLQIEAVTTVKIMRFSELRFCRWFYTLKMEPICSSHSLVTIGNTNQKAVLNFCHYSLCPDKNETVYL